jgi:hypothetical protein
VEHVRNPATRRDLVKTAVCCTLLLVASNLVNFTEERRQTAASVRLGSAFDQFAVDSATWRAHHHEVLEQLARDADRQFAELHAELEEIRARISR